MKNKKKIITYGVAGTGILAAGLAGAIAALAEDGGENITIAKFSADYKRYGQITTTKQNLLKYLQDNIDNETQTSTLSPEVEREIYSLLNELEEVEKNPNMDYTEAQKIKDKMDRALAYAKLQDAILKNSSDNINHSVDEIVNQIKDPEIRAQLQEVAGDLINSIKDDSISKEDKLKLVDKLKETTQSLYDKQSDLLAPTQQTLWKLKDELANNVGYFKPEQKAKAEAMIKALESALSGDIFSAQNIEELKNDLDNAYNDLIESKKETENEYQKYLEKSQQAKQTILASNLPKEQKEQLLAKLSSFDQQAANKDSQIANNKLDEILFLEKEVDNLINNLDDLNKDSSVLVEEAKAVILDKPTLTHANVNSVLDAELNAIQEKLNAGGLTQEDALKLKNQAKTLIENAQTNQNSIDNTNAMVEKALADGVISPEQATELKNTLASINGDDLSTFSADANQKIEDVIEKLVRAEKINNDIKKLEDKINERLSDPDADLTKVQEIAKALDAFKAQSLDKWDDVDSEHDKTWAGEDEIAKLYDQLRDANKSELKNLIAKGEDLLNDPDISDSIKEQIKNLQMNSTPLTNDYSSSTNSQIEPKIEQYKKLLEDAKLNKKVADLNKYTSDLKNKIAKMPQENGQHPQAKILTDKANELLNKVNAVYSDPTKTNEEKEAEINALKAEIEAVEAKLSDLEKLMDQQKRLKDAIASLDSNPEIKQQLLEEIQKANELMNNQDSVFADPSNNDIPNEIQKLKDLEDLIRSKQNNLNSDQYYKKALAQLNSSFAPYRNGVVSTVLEAKLRAELEKQKAVLDNPNTSPSEYHDAVEKIKALHEKIKPAADLEKKRRELTEQIQIANDTNSQLSPETQKIDTTSAVDKLNAINNFINDLNVDIVSQDEIDTLKEDANKEIENLKVEQEKAKLRDSIGELMSFITPADENDSQEYKDLAQLVTDSITAAQDQANNIANNSSNIPEIQNTKMKVENAIPLAQKLKEAQEKFKELNDPKYALIAEQLKKVMDDNSINLNDSPEEVNKKIKAINDELNKIQTKKEIIDQLEQMKSIYSDDDSNKAIFKESKPALENTIAEFNEKLKDGNLSSSDLLALKRDIVKTNQKAKIEKAKLEKRLVDEYDEAKALYNQLKEEANRRGMSDSDLVKLEEIWNQIQSFNPNESGFINEATPDKIKDLKDKMNLGYLKDLFAFKKKSVESSIAKLPETTPYGEETESPTDKIKNSLNESLDAWTNGVDNEEENPAILKEYIAKLDSLNGYIDESDQILNEYKTNNNKADLINAINNNLVSPNDGAQNIDKKAQNLSTARVDAMNLDEYREKTKKGIESLSNELEALSSDWANNQLKGENSLQSELNTLISSVQNADGKAQIKDIEDKFKKIKQNFDNIKGLAQTTNDVLDEINSALNEEGMEDNELLNLFKKRFEDDLQAESKEQYINPDPAKIEELKEKAATYKSTLISIKEFNKKYKDTFDKLNALEYQEGFGNIDAQTFKLNDSSSAEDFSTLTPQNIKKGMEVSLETYKVFAEKIQYATQPMLDIKKEINNLNGSLDKFSNLLDTEKEVQEKYTVVQNNTSALGTEFNSLHPSAPVSNSYGFDLDKKHIGEAILNSGITSTTSNGNNEFSSLTFDQMRSKYLELKANITSLRNKNSNQTQKTVANLSAKLDVITDELNAIINDLNKEKNDLSILVLKLSIQKERQTEIAAQEYYGKVYTPEQKAENQNEINSLETQIREKLQNIAEKERELANKKQENTETFYDLKFVEYKIKETEDQINALADALYVKSFEKPADAGIQTRAEALGWKNELIESKDSQVFDDVEIRYDLYKTRDKKFNEIKKLANSLNDKLPQEASENKDNLSDEDLAISTQRYQVFNTKISDIAVQMLEYIQTSVSIDDLDQYMNFVDNIRNKFEDYKTISNIILDFELSIKELEQDEYSKNNPHVASLIAQLKNEVDFVKGQMSAADNNLNAFVWYSNSQNVINEWKKILRFQLTKIKFYKEYIKQQKTLDTYKQSVNNSNNPQNDDNVWFDQNEYAPLQAILNNAFSDLYNSDYLTEDDMEKLETKYFVGDEDTSIKVARKNSVSLKEDIKEAKRIWENRAVNESGQTSDTEKMNVLYNDLLNSYTSAQLQLEKPLHDELNKTLAEDDISNSSTGKIARLRDQKLKELNSQISFAKDINNYVSQNYKGSNSPKLDDFEQLAIDELVETINIKDNVDFIRTSNEKIKQSQDKVLEQLKKVFDYENNSLKSLIVRSKQYVKLFKLQEQYLQTSGIDVNEFSKLFGFVENKPEELRKLQEIIDVIASIEREMGKAESDLYNSDKASSWQIDEEYNSDEETVYTPEQYENYSDTIEKVKQKKKTLNSKYNLVKQIARLKLKTYKADFDEAKNELSSDDANKLGQLIKNLGFNTNTETRKQTFLVSAAFGTDTEHTSSSNPLDEPVADAGKEELVKSLEKFVNYAKAILETNNAFNLYVFGENTTDLSGLKNTYVDYIDKRSDISVFLKFLVGDSNESYYSADANENVIFEKFLKAFNIQKEQAQAIKQDKVEHFLKQELDDENLDYPSMMLIDIKRMLVSARSFRDWLNADVNKADLFDYLYKKSKIDDSANNYNDLEPKDGKYADDWVEKVEELSRTNDFVETLVVNGVEKDAFKVTEERFLDSLFERFSILKQGENQVFKRDNFEVWIYKDKNSPNAKFLEEIFQATPSYKNLKYNIYIRYLNSNEDARNSVFSDVGNVSVARPNTQTRFKTFSRMIINDENIAKFYPKGGVDFLSKIQNPAFWKQEPWKSNSANLFDFKRGGLATDAAPGIIASGLSEVQNIFPDQNYLVSYSSSEVQKMVDAEYTLNDLTTNKLFDYDTNLRYIKTKINKIIEIPADSSSTSLEEYKAEVFAELIKEWKRNLRIQDDRFTFRLTEKLSDGFRVDDTKTNDPLLKLASDVTFWKFVQPDSQGRLLYGAHRVGVPIYDTKTKKIGLMLLRFQIPVGTGRDFFVGGIFSSSNTYINFPKSNSEEYKYNVPAGNESPEQLAEIEKSNREKAIRIADEIFLKILNKNGDYFDKELKEKYTRLPYGSRDLEEDVAVFPSKGFLRRFKTDYQIKIYKSDIEVESDSE